MPSRKATVQRVAMLSTHTSPLAPLGHAKTGGMNVYVRELSRELARRDIAVDVYTRAVEPKQAPVQLDHRVENFRVIHVPAGPATNLSTDEVVAFLPEFIDGVVRFAAHHNHHYDLIHSHYWLSGLVARQLRASWGRIPHIHMFHTLGPMKSLIAGKNGEPASRVRIRGEGAVVRAAHRIVAATPSENRQLQRFYQAPAHKIVEIPPGVDLERFHRVAQKQARNRLGLDVDRRLILFVGRIEPLKGIDTLLQAISLLQQAYPALALQIDAAVIGGDPQSTPLEPEMARLVALQKQLGLERTVRFLGAKHQEEIAHYYAAADVLVMPSLYESFGMVALEAMATGTPVIGTDVGGLSHLIDHGVTGFHIPPRAPDVLATRLLELLLDDLARLRMGCRARQKAQAYGWPRITDQVLDLYHELIRTPALTAA